LKLIICGVKSAVERKPAVFLFNAFCDECNVVHEWSCCPECGSWIAPSFGIGGGGFGSYWVCEEFCGWISAVEEAEE
jgi:hypothetical protein